MLENILNRSFNYILNLLIFFDIIKNFEIIEDLIKLMYGIMTDELREIRTDKAAGRSDSDSPMTSFEVIMPLKLQSTKY